MKVLKNFLFVSCLLWVTVLTGMEAPVPDESYRCKKLENGFTYYIKKNKFPPNKASIRLFVKAGSLHEEDHQQGLAHFLEHMLFRGSENFKDWEVINFLESIGAKFGPDTNAYTSFGQTVYQLEIPLEKEGVLDKAILICSDWAGRATIDDAFVEKERSVVADEYNMSQKQAVSRQMRKFFDLFLGDSLYNKRWPIGLKEVILHCDPQAIRDFYKKWYRSDRMALAIVGDFDEDVVEALIVKHFSDLPTPTEEVIEPDTSLDFPEDSHFEVLQDDEQMVNIGMICSFFDHKIDPEEPKIITEETMRRSIFRSIFLHTLAQRLDNVGKQNPSPYVQHFLMNFEIDRIGVRGVGFIPFETRPIDGMKAVLRETARMIFFGPTEQEFKDGIEMLIQNTKNALANVDRIEHATFAYEFLDHYYEGFPVYDHSDRLNYKASLLDAVNREEMVNWIKESSFEPFKHVVFEVADSSLITPHEIEEGIEAWVSEVIEEAENVEAKEFASTRNEEDHEENDAKALSVEEQSTFTYMTLENGMKIILHPTALEKDQVIFKFFAPGGQSLLREEVFPAIDPFVEQYTESYGLGNLDSVEFKNFLDKKQISLFYHIAATHRSVTLSSTKEHLRTLLELANAAFYGRTKDTNAWQTLKDKMVEVYKNLDNNPYFYFSKFIGKHYRKDHPTFRIHEPSEASEDMLMEVMDQLFSDPSEFCLVVVGDFDRDELQAQLPSLFNKKNGKKEKRSEVIPYGVFPDHAEDVVIHKGKETHSLNYLIIGGNLEFPEKKGIRTTQGALDQIMGHRLLTKIRQEMGDTYSIYMTTIFPFYPDLKELLVFIVFTCEPDKSAQLKEVIKEEIDLLVEEGVTEEEVANAKQILLEQNKSFFLSNKGILGAHEVAELSGISYDYFFDYEPRIDETVTKEEIDAFARAAFAKDHHVVSYSVVPEKQE